MIGSAPGPEFASKSDWCLLVSESVTLTADMVAESPIVVSATETTAEETVKVPIEQKERASGKHKKHKHKEKEKKHKHKKGRSKDAPDTSDAKCNAQPDEALKARPSPQIRRYNTI